MGTERSGAECVEQRASLVWLPGVTGDTPAMHTAVNNVAAPASFSVDVKLRQGTLLLSSRQALVGYHIP